MIVFTHRWPRGAGYVSEQENQVWAALDQVLDPELDESIVTLHFVERVCVEEPGSVAIFFRLPTYWCGANFTYLMVEDIYTHVRALAWVDQVHVYVQDHFAAEEISAAIEAGKNFAEAFPDNTGEEDVALQQLRLGFQKKSFLGRQERLLRHLLRHGWSPQRLATLTRDALATEVLTPMGQRLRDRYLALRDEIATVGQKPLAFVTLEGEAIAPQDFPHYLHEIRRSRVNIEFNTAFCEGLLQTRYGLSFDAEQSGIDGEKEESCESSATGRLS